MRGESSYKAIKYEEKALRFQIQRNRQEGLSSTSVFPECLFHSIEKKNKTKKNPLHVYSMSKDQPVAMQQLVTAKSIRHPTAGQVLTQQAGQLI